MDGDNAAAMRYTEARMTEVARLLLEGIDEDTVDFRPTYDGEDEEPIVLPAAFPNLLANGAQGIAVNPVDHSFTVRPHRGGAQIPGQKRYFSKKIALPQVGDILQHALLAINIDPQGPLRDDIKRAALLPLAHHDLGKADFQPARGLGNLVNFRLGQN